MESSAIEHFNADIIAHFAALSQRTLVLEKERDEASQERDELRHKLSLQEQHCLYFKQRYELLQRELFGRKSEARELFSSVLQGLLPGFDDAGRPAPPQESETTPISYTRQKPTPKEHLKSVAPGSRSLYAVSR